MNHLVVHEDPAYRKLWCLYDSTDKANILNKQFKSVFTVEDVSAIPQLEGPRYPTIEGLTIYPDGVHKLFASLKSDKASGPKPLFHRSLRKGTRALPRTVDPSH